MPLTTRSSVARGAFRFLKSITRFRFPFLLAVALGAGLIGLLHAQKPFAEYRGQTAWPLPPDYQETREWVWARLRYSSGGGFFGGGGRRGGGAWGTDYPKGDRLLVQGLRRLTLLDTRSVEQTVDLDGSDDVYNWPFLYAVEVGQWVLSDAEALQLRDYIDRGGFFMVDDFHGEGEWADFMASMELVFPDRIVEDIPDDDPINSVVYDLGERPQIPGAQFVNSGRTYERSDGQVPHWRGIYDAKRRLMTVMVHNSDLGDAIEYADQPYYPERYAQAAFRILSNYVIYDLTH